MKRILVMPGRSETDEPVLASALAAARPVGAHLEFIHAVIDPTEALRWHRHAGFAMGPALGATMDRLRLRLETRADSGVSASWRDEGVEIERLVFWARHHDLVVLSRPSGENGLSTGLLELMLVGCGNPGVAVATALVLPLAAAGILAARADFAMPRGALVLALTNIVAIQVAFSVVFWVGGYRWLTSGSEQSIGSFFLRSFVGLALISLLAVILAIQFHVISNCLFESQVRKVLGRYFGNSSEFRVISIDISKSGHDTVVRAVVRGPRPSAAEVAEGRAHLPTTPHSTSVRLRVRFVQIAIVTPQGLILDDEGDDHESERVGR